MKRFFKSDSQSGEAGFSGILLLFIILFVLIGGFAAFDFGYIKYTEGQNVPYPTVTPYPGEVRTPVTASGSFTKDKYTVNITLRFLLEGGSVSGEFSGACDGNITGSYDGKDGGVISGKAVGSCDPFFVPIPAQGTFTGTVNQKGKTIPVTGTGGVAGITGSGSLILTY